MKKVNLNNLYESPYPPTDINTLWVDKDESTGKIRAIHKYNIAKGEWEPDMVSVDYMKPTEPEKSLVVYSNSDFESDASGTKFLKKLWDSENTFYCMIDKEWQCEDSSKDCLAQANLYDTNNAGRFWTESDGSVSPFQTKSGSLKITKSVAYIGDNSIRDSGFVRFYLMTEDQYNTFRQTGTKTEGSPSMTTDTGFLIVAELTKK